jgi:hypothetical protein
MKQKTDIFIPRPILKTFVSLALFAFVVQIALTLLRLVFIAYPADEGSRFSVWAIYSLGVSILPCALFVAGYFLTLRSEGRLIRVFLATLYALLFIFINTCMGKLLLVLLQAFPSQTLSPAIELVPTLLAVIIVTVILFVARPRSGKTLDSRVLTQRLLITLYSVIVAIAATATLYQFLRYNQSILNNFIPLLAVCAALIFVAFTYMLLSRHTSPSDRVTKALFYPLLPALVAVIMELLFPFAIWTLGSIGLRDSLLELHASPTPVITIIAVYLLVVALASRKNLL